MVQILDMIAERFVKHPQLLQLLASPKTLSVLLSSLAVLSDGLALQIIRILEKIFTHPSEVPTELLEVSCQ